VADDGSIAQMLGLNVGAAWTLFWMLFFIRLVLGFAIGIDEIRMGFRKPLPPPAGSPEMRALRGGNLFVTALNGILVLLYLLLTPWLPRF
jgi:hypothetical protein